MSASAKTGQSLSDGRYETVIDEITRMQPAELLVAAASPSL
ncbi:hypothetical protein [Candidatus Electronema sp. PJ]